MGVTEPLISRKNDFFDQDQHYSEAPFCGGWVMTHKMTGSGDIILKELAGVVMAHADPLGHVCGAIGGPVSSVHSAMGKAQNAQKAAPANSIGERADGMFQQFGKAWKAGTWSAAKGTHQEYTIAVGSMLVGGFMTMNPGGNGELSGICRYFNADNLDRAQSEAEARGRGETGRQFVLDTIATNRGWKNGRGVRYDYSAATGKVTIQ